MPLDPLTHPKCPEAKFHVTSDRTTHLTRGSTHLILDERKNPIDGIDEKLSYHPNLVHLGRSTATGVILLGKLLGNTVYSCIYPYYISLISASALRTTDA